MAIPPGTESVRGGTSASRKAILAGLRGFPFVRSVIDGFDLPMKNEFLNNADWLSVPCGTTLMCQGDVSTDVYLLVSGRLGILVDNKLGWCPVQYAQPGEIIGEMSIFLGEPRSATVSAMRDSELVRISEPLFRQALDASPALMRHMLGLLSQRLKRATSGDKVALEVEAISILPLGNAFANPAAIEPLYAAFASLIPGARLVREAPEEDVTANGFTLYSAGANDSSWRHRCIRQTDRVVFVANAGTAPDSAHKSDFAYAASMGRPVDVMLLNPAGALRPKGGAAWLDLVPPGSILHVIEGEPADYARVARMVTGQANCLVLSGGGARGFAHIGVIRAFHDAGVPIDMICGTSMGGLVAASAALDLDPTEVLRKVHHSFVLNNPVGDYTLPIFSLARGRRMTRLLRQHFDEARIEDMWRGFFCISANLTRGKVHIHSSGAIWEALRATSAIPGVVPPYLKDGEIFVDGGIMNNFPADIMQSLSRGRVIGAEVSAQTIFNTELEDIEGQSILWMLSKESKKFPNVVKLLMRAITVGSDAHAASARQLVDMMIEPELGAIDMLSFDQFDAAVEAGYQATKAVLAAD